MPFTREQKQAIQTLDMANNFAKWLQHEPASVRLVCYSDWKLVTRLGEVQLSEIERQAVQQALRNVHGRNAGPQLPKFRDALL